MMPTNDERREVTDEDALRGVMQGLFGGDWE